MKVSLDRMRVKAHPIGLFRDFFNLNFKKKTKDRKMAFLGTDRIRTDTLPPKAKGDLFDWSFFQKGRFFVYL